MGSDCASAAASRSVDVALVGAGVSGLAAANLLAAKHTVALLDARARVGGRLLSPLGLDLGGSWSWPPHDRHVSALARRLGVRATPQHLRGEAFAHSPGGGVVSVGAEGERMAPCGPGAVRFRSGYASLANALAAELPSDALMLGSKVVALEASEGGGVRVTYESEGAPEPLTLHARRVILAVPPAVHARGVRCSPPLPEPQRRLMLSTSTWCGEWCKVVATFRRPFWRGRGASGVAATAGVWSVWWEGGSGEGGEEAALVGLGVGEEACKALSAYADTGVNEESPEQVRQLVVEAVGSVYGKQLVLEELQSVRHKSWMDDPLTFAPGTSHRPYGHPLLSRPTEWGLHFAGTETEAQNGHVEGAIAAGERAAKEVLDALEKSG